MKTSSFQIYGEDTIQMVRDKFSQLFPQLIINFYCQNEKITSGDSCVMFSPECRICDINHRFKDGTIQIKKNMTINEIEHAIHSFFGLHVEITGNMQGHNILRGQFSKWIFNEKYPDMKFLIDQSDRSGYRDIPFSF